MFENHCSFAGVFIFELVTTKPYFAAVYDICSLSKKITCIAPVKYQVDVKQHLSFGNFSNLRQLGHPYGEWIAKEAIATRAASALQDYSTLHVKHTVREILKQQPYSPIL